MAAERLSGLDLAFACLERPGTPMHMGRAAGLRSSTAGAPGAVDRVAARAGRGQSAIACPDTRHVATPGWRRVVGGHDVRRGPARSHPSVTPPGKHGAAGRRHGSADGGPAAAGTPAVGTARRHRACRWAVRCAGENASRLGRRSRRTDRAGFAAGRYRAHEAHQGRPGPRGQEFGSATVARSCGRGAQPVGAGRPDRRSRGRTVTACRVAVAAGQPDRSIGASAGRSRTGGCRRVAAHREAAGRHPQRCHAGSPRRRFAAVAAGAR